MKQFYRLIFLGIAIFGLQGTTSWAAVTTDPNNIISKFGNHFASIWQDLKDSNIVYTNQCVSQSLPNGKVSVTCPGIYKTIEESGFVTVSFSCWGTFAKDGTNYTYLPKDIECDSK